MKYLCVFCGSRLGNQARYREEAHQLGLEMARRGIGLVFGGGHIGLMGVLADAVLEAGGKVEGVIPQALVDKELAHAGLTRLHIVDTMHQRKALMAELSDAFAGLPGGYGTGDELFEMLTWAQLKLHAKPIGLLNSTGYFDPMLAWLDHMNREDFLQDQSRALIRVALSPADLLDRLLGRPT